jgi:hypothetical protein
MYHAQFGCFLMCNKYLRISSLKSTDPLFLYLKNGNGKYLSWRAFTQIKLRRMRK